MYSIPDIADVTTEQFDRTIKTNIYGTFWMTKFAVPHIPKGGSIIVTASQVRFVILGELPYSFCDSHTPIGPASSGVATRCMGWC
jgi:NAD(P)-dependent dehydrogenase (short-subunit alcohol dehydrogenase family)